MATIKISPVYHSATPKVLLNAQKDRTEKLLNDLSVQWVENDIHALLFMTGGTEQEATKKIGADHHVTLLAYAEHNAYASATEVKAWLDDQGIPCDLFNLSDTSDILNLIAQTELREKVRNFTSKQLGIIGNESPWLINSTPNPELLRNRFGFRMIRIPHETLEPIESFPVSPEFLEAYRGFGKPELEMHSRVYTMITQVIQENKLDAISVECFPMVEKKAVTACLSLALLNKKHIPASCEGDLTSLVGMMLIKYLFGFVPWMANLSGVFTDRIELSHCTAPIDSLLQYQITTHFETGKGLALEGEMPRSPYTVFRLDKYMMRACVIEGEVTDNQSGDKSCRTRVHMNIKEEDIAKLRHHPLGNHHILIPGKRQQELLRALRFMNITEI